MDQGRFDSLARSLAAPKTRRGLLGTLAALGAGLVGARPGHAQVTQAQCGNQFCASAPGGCKPGCVCCVYSNGNSRCRPPGTCSPGVVLCPPGQVVGADGRCAVPGGCADAVLAGAGGPTTSFLVDDDLEVFVNGASVFLDNNENAGNIGPIALGSLANGDDLRVVASDSATPVFCGGATVLDPITLYCPSTGASQVINPTRVQGFGFPCGHIFFDETIPVAL